ncbi:MAG: hypothetical protein ACYC6M_06555 [Terriglobales bacterium]
MTQPPSRTQSGAPVGIPTGFEQRGKVTALLLLTVLALLFVWRAFRSDNRPAAVAQKATQADAMSLPDPSLHLAALDAVRQQEYAGSGRDLFRSEGALDVAGAAGDPRRPAKPVIKPASPAMAVNTGPPPPPPIPLKFYGYVAQGNTQRKVFLQMADNVYVVQEGQIIEHRFVVQKIGPVSVQIEDLQTKQTQIIPLVQS